MSRLLFWSGLIFLALLSPFVGVAELKLEALLHNDPLSVRIFTELRLPRILLAFFAGGLLAVAGLLFQTLFRNALMTPFTLGVSSGAVLGAGIAIKLGVGLALGVSAVTLFATGGALATIILVLWLARFLQRAEHESLLLLGIALSFFYTSALTVLFYISSHIESHEILRFTMGSLSVVGYGYTLTALAVAVAVVLFLRRHRHALQLMGVSDEQARLKGVDTRRLTLLLLGMTSIGVGIVVSMVGPIGFVGLVVPHMVGRLYQKGASHIIFTVFFAGALFLLACDTLARAFSSGSEIPIGVVTAFVGGPFFIYLILKRSR